jgi:hypothetical protein
MRSFGLSFETIPFDKGNATTPNSLSTIRVISSPASFFYLVGHHVNDGLTCPVPRFEDALLQHLETPQEVLFRGAHVYLIRRGYAILRLNHPCHLTPIGQCDFCRDCELCA